MSRIPTVGSSVGKLGESKEHKEGMQNAEKISKLVGKISRPKLADTFTKESQGRKQFTAIGNIYSSTSPRVSGHATRSGTPDSIKVDAVYRFGDNSSPHKGSVIFTKLFIELTSVNQGADMDRKFNKTEIYLLEHHLKDTPFVIRFKDRTGECVTVNLKTNWAPAKESMALEGFNRIGRINASLAKKYTKSLLLKLTKTRSIAAEMLQDKSTSSTKTPQSPARPMSDKFDHDYQKDTLGSTRRSNPSESIPPPSEFPTNEVDYAPEPNIRKRKPKMTTRKRPRDSEDESDNPTEKLSREHKQALPVLLGDTPTKDKPGSTGPDLLESPRKSARLMNKLDSSRNATEPSEDPTSVICIYLPAGVAAKNAVTIKQSDLNRLGPGEFLNDTLIQFWLLHIQYEIYGQEERNQIHVFSSYFYQKLTTPPKHVDEMDFLGDSKYDAAYQRVARWTKTVDIFSKKYVFIPINQHAHWYLAVIVMPNRHPRRTVNSKIIPYDNTRVKGQLGTKGVNQEFDVQDMQDSNADLENDDKTFVVILDSLAQQPRRKVVRNIREYLQREWNARKNSPDIPDMVYCKENFKGTHAKVPFQMNSVDCGLFLLQYVEEMIGNPLSCEKTPIECPTWFSKNKISTKRADIFDRCKALEREQTLKASKYPKDGQLSVGLQAVQGYDDSRSASACSTYASDYEKDMNVKADATAGVDADADAVASVSESMMEDEGSTSENEFIDQYEHAELIQPSVSTTTNDGDDDFGPSDTYGRRVYVTSEDCKDEKDETLVKCSTSSIRNLSTRKAKNHTLSPPCRHTSVQGCINKDIVSCTFESANNPGPDDQTDATGCEDRDDSTHIRVYTNWEEDSVSGGSFSSDSMENDSSAEWKEVPSTSLLSNRIETYSHDLPFNRHSREKEDAFDKARDHEYVKTNVSRRTHKHFDTIDDTCVNVSTNSAKEPLDMPTSAQTKTCTEMDNDSNTVLSKSPSNLQTRPHIDLGVTSQQAKQFTKKHGVESTDGASQVGKGQDKHTSVGSVVDGTVGRRGNTHDSMNNIDTPDGKLVPTPTRIHNIHTHAQAFIPSRLYKQTHIRAETPPPAATEQTKFDEKESAIDALDGTNSEYNKLLEERKERNINPDLPHSATPTHIKFHRTQTAARVSNKNYESSNTASAESPDADRPGDVDVSPDAVPRSGREKSNEVIILAASSTKPGSPERVNSSPNADVNGIPVYSSRPLHNVSCKIENLEKFSTPLKELQGSVLDIDTFRKSRLKNNVADVPFDVEAVIQADAVNVDSDVEHIELQNNEGENANSMDVDLVNIDANDGCTTARGQTPTRPQSQPLPLTERQQQALAQTTPGKSLHKHDKIDSLLYDREGRSLAYNVALSSSTYIKDCDHVNEKLPEAALTMATLELEDAHISEHPYTHTDTDRGVDNHTSMKTNRCEFGHRRRENVSNISHVHVSKDAGRSTFQHTPTQTHRKNTHTYEVLERKGSVMTISSDDENVTKSVSLTPTCTPTSTGIAMHSAYTGALPAMISSPTQKLSPIRKTSLKKNEQTRTKAYTQSTIITRLPPTPTHSGAQQEDEPSNINMYIHNSSIPTIRPSPKPANRSVQEEGRRANDNDCAHVSGIRIVSEGDRRKQKVFTRKCRNQQEVLESIKLNVADDERSTPYANVPVHASTQMNTQRQNTNKSVGVGEEESFYCSTDMHMRLNSLKSLGNADCEQFRLKCPQPWLGDDNVIPIANTDYAIKINPTDTDTKPNIHHTRTTEQIDVSKVPKIPPDAIAIPTVAQQTARTRSSHGLPTSGINLKHLPTSGLNLKQSTLNGRTYPLSRAAQRSPTLSNSVEIKARVNVGCTTGNDAQSDLLDKKTWNKDFVSPTSTHKGVCVAENLSQLSKDVEDLTNDDEVDSLNTSVISGPGSLKKQKQKPFKSKELLVPGKKEYRTLF
eukprot:CFRG8471T1